ncbi:hypothetical protein FOZ61_000640 [Perkinsus olseni]|uniref:Uncharacterized protein n=1 Tax=Perkinsus olseni TaxID=32597 RepID=A0A7J6LZQ5_PEROL|nr:hypothetical protein FOZ61_000640 [Perkinsus olseni]
MTSIVIVLAAIAATVVAEGTTALNTTYPPTPDLNRGPPITGHDVWWMLASKKIDELLQAEQEAAGGARGEGEVEGPTTEGPPTSTTTTTSPTTTTSGSGTGQLRGGVGSSTSAAWNEGGGVAWLVMTELLLMTFTN